jgi:biopolymer transport protein ExbD
MGMVMNPPDGYPAPRLVGIALVAALHLAIVAALVHGRSQAKVDFAHPPIETRIITIPMQTHAVKIELPEGALPAKTTPPPVVAIEVDADGTVLWDKTIVPDRATLERYMTSAAVSVPQPEIHLAVNKLARYAPVAMVLAEAQRLGIVRIGVIASVEDLE